jgi:predicted lactoylglutathione lyase
MFTKSQITLPFVARTHHQTKQLIVRLFYIFIFHKTHKMVKEFWINLPVRDVAKSKEFFVNLGFSLNKEHGNTANSASLQIGQKKAVVMLFNEEMFQGFTNSEIAKPEMAEVLLSIDAESKGEVDEMAKRAVAAGGKSNHTPSEMKGWMYGCIFTDLDGHRWNVLYMDMNKMPKG